MKINNYSNEIRKIMLYGGNVQTEKEINPYNVKAFFNTINMLGDEVTSFDDYFKIVAPNLIESTNNPTHIKAKQKKGLIFVVWVADKYGYTNGVLYIPFNKVITHEVIEEKKDMRGDGCINVSYNDKIIFNDEIKVICKDSEHYFAKGSDPVRSHSDSVESLDDCILKEKEHMAKYPSIYKNAARLINLYESKKAEGFEYRCFAYRCREVNYNYLVFYNCVDHYEKTPEYVKAEKLTETLKSINKHWGVDDTIKLLKRFKLTKKRESKKGE